MFFLKMAQCFSTGKPVARETQSRKDERCWRTATILLPSLRDWIVCALTNPALKCWAILSGRLGQEPDNHS